MTTQINLIDNLFKSYNYKVEILSTPNIRAYTLQYGMYHAAEIISFEESTDVNHIRKQFSDLGYATEHKVVKNITEVEEYLFEGFFIKTPLGHNLRSRYKNFVNKQIKNLPEGSTYKYIDSDFDFSLQNNLGEIEEVHTYENNEKSIIDKIDELFKHVKGALFVIIEAPAGFGKTCTANEILNKITLENSKRLPFFTELSRNREARVFKHILLNEIDNQFPNGIKQKVVLEQIYQGRIPLIIDGFDELITKDSNKEDVESMLSTIVDLLKNNAKIIITSRKTAILNSTEFIDTIFNSIDDFNIARFEIKDPTINNWLSDERLELINKHNFPIQQLSNPVLLSYIRNIPLDKLNNYISSNHSTLIDKYFTYLLTREQERQNLKLSNEEQFRIFRKLNRFMAELNFTAEEKETIKSFIKDYNQQLLLESTKKYKSDERPSIDDLTETLSNHVFLDRKSDGYIGFINDFIFGYLIAENLILEKFQEHYLDKFTSIIPLDFSIKAINSFRIQTKENKEKLWEVYHNNNFNYDINFYFDLDYFLKQKLMRNYDSLFLSNVVIKKLIFNIEITNCNFSSVTFENCTFYIDKFHSTSFQSCKFLDCEFIKENEFIQYDDFALFASKDNNGFIENIKKIYSKNDDIDVNEIDESLSEILVLQQFLQVDLKRPKPRKFSIVKERLSQYSDKEINNVIDNLIRKQYLHFKDDVGFITREAMNFLNHN